MDCNCSGLLTAPRGESAPWFFATTPQPNPRAALTRGEKPTKFLATPPWLEGVANGVFDGVNLMHAYGAGWEAGALFVLTGGLGWPVNGIGLPSRPMV